MKTYHAMVGIGANASQEQITNAHKKLIKYFHADGNPKFFLKPDTMQEIGEVYAARSELVTRYDKLFGMVRDRGTPGHAFPKNSFNLNIFPKNERALDFSYTKSR